jgi:hypothetical protein
VLADESSAVFAGKLLFIRENTLMAQPFDAASGQIVGEPLRVADGISFTTANGHAPVSVSETGALLYVSGGFGNNLVWSDRAGKLLGTISAEGPAFEPAISLDEKRFVFRRGRGLRLDLWLRDLARGAEQRFTADSFSHLAPFWSPSGDHIVFSSSRDGGEFDLYQKATNGTGQDELLLSDRTNKAPTQWSRDGRFIVYRLLDPKTAFDIWVLPMDRGAHLKPFAFLHSEFNELFGQLSPDNRWMAYTSDDSGRREVYVRPFPAGEGRINISIAGGEQPRWSGAGKELFFVSADRRMMSVAVKATAGPQPSFEAGSPQPMFEVHLAQSARDALFEYDVTADGKRFLLATSGSASAAALTVVSNWDVELKK